MERRTEAWPSPRERELVENAAREFGRGCDHDRPSNFIVSVCRRCVRAILEQLIADAALAAGGRDREEERGFIQSWMIRHCNGRFDRFAALELLDRYCGPEPKAPDPVEVEDTCNYCGAKHCIEVEGALGVLRLRVSVLEKHVERLDARTRLGPQSVPLNTGVGGVGRDEAGGGGERPRCPKCGCVYAASSMGTTCLCG